MARRFYTCIILPDASHRLHKLKIPQKAIYCFAVFGVLSLLVAVALGFHYVRMAIKASNFERLEAENSDLKVKTTNLQISATKLISKINDLETLSKKLTKVVENDPAFSQSRKVNAQPEGGSRTDISTSQLQTGSDLNANLDLLRNRAEGLEDQYNLLDQLIDKRVGLAAVTPSIWPVRGSIASPFGRRLDPFDGTADVHLGLDESLDPQPPEPDAHLDAADRGGRGPGRGGRDGGALRPARITLQQVFDETVPPRGSARGLGVG